MRDFKKKYKNQGDEIKLIKTIMINDKEVYYNFEHKKVKNINLRIKSDGTINVSANKFVSQRVVENFIISKSDFILNALNRYENMQKTQNTRCFEDDELKECILNLCKQVYPYFENKGVKYPEIKFKKMVSRWGSCHTLKGVLTFNTNLIYAPKECVEYVVLHEFTHFLQPNHSKWFYAELEKTCPNWKMLRKKLKEINIHKN